MKTILKTTIVSIVASACILSFSGCIDDRADFGTDLNVTGKMIELDPTKDHDGDGLLTGDEINKHGTNPENPDSDGDGLDDGLEIKIGTKPQAGFEDTDGDGVTDGVEVVGTYEDDIAPDGKVITAGNKQYPIKDGLLVVDNEHKAISIADFEGKTPANIHKNTITDPDDKIDALDPMNDSDYDKRPNIKEKERKTDPLDQKSFYPWIYETPVGKVMEEAGFVYIPGGFDLDGGGNESGFWMAKYEARGDVPTTITVGPLQTFINKHFAPSTNIYIDDAAASSGESLFVPKYDTDSGEPLTGMYAYEMAALVSQNQIAGVIDANITGEPIKLPLNKQYAHVLKLIGDYKTDNVKNSTTGYDANVEENYERAIYEISSKNREVTRDLLELKKFTSLPLWWNVSEISRSDKNKAAASANVFLAKDTGVGLEQDDYAVIVRDGEKLNLIYGVTYAEKTYNGFRAASDYLEE